MIVDINDAIRSEHWKKHCVTEDLTLQGCPNLEHRAQLLARTCSKPTQPLADWGKHLSTMLHQALPLALGPKLFGPLALEIFGQVADISAASSYKMFAPCLPTQKFETWSEIEIFEKVAPFNQSGQWVNQWLLFDAVCWDQLWPLILKKGWWNQAAKSPNSPIGTKIWGVLGIDGLQSKTHVFYIITFLWFLETACVLIPSRHAKPNKVAYAPTQNS